MQYKPHDYQQYAINYILEHPIAAVILGMGLGKTSITLTAIEQLMYDSFEINKVLVVAPLRVARNTWSDEIHKWEHLKHLKYSIVLGTAADRKKALAADADIYVINRENLQWLVEQSGVSFDFDMVVLDELSSFKNWNSKRFKAFMKVRPKVKRVIGLTGTPSSNGLIDLFAEFKCLDMGERLGRFISQYRVNYFVPDQTNGQIVYSYRLRKGAEEQIYNKISDITISMKALDHLKMPELISNEYPVYMSEHEASLYDDMEAEMFLPLRTGEITAANAAALSGKLLQMANGAVYSDDGDEIQIHDQKLDALEDLIEAANGKPVMVAYWFKHDLTRIRRRLSERKISFEKLDSEESIRKWNRGELPVALIHPASAGHGLNLQSGGNILIWFGLTWSLELYQQTVARLWRQDELNADEGIINFQNGILRLADMALLPHSPEVLSTIQIPCEWHDSPTPTPVYDAYLSRLVNYDAEMEDLCNEINGVVISNVNCSRMKKSVFFVGDGNTGKSQLKSLVEHLLGPDNYIGIDLKDIEARFGTGAIYGTRLAGSSDMSFVSIGELKTFKSLTGGDSVFAEFKGQQPFKFFYKGFLWFCMNRLPRFGGDDGQWVFDRIMIIHCENVIPESEQDKQLLDKMYAERDGIIHKAVMALKTVIENGYRFSEPQTVREARQSYMEETNTALAFFTECMEQRSGQKIADGCTTGKVFDVYRAWCTDNNNGYAKTSREFRDAISAYLGMAHSDLTVHTKKGNFYRDYTLSDEAKERYSKAYGSDFADFLS